MEHRPDPDQLLESIRADEPDRGRLKIFMGYAAGVGKTYAMLEAAHQRLQEGVDILVGYVETHNRLETEELLKGLQVLPRTHLSYHGVMLPEMDVDAILALRPTLVLVDEFAHTNAPGSRHPKRYQDVEELLDAGIDVYTTLNIQHLESLNDVVAQVTGVVVRETVPDRVIDEASEIEVIDLPPDELLQRLKDGKVYIPDQAARAIQKFFRKGNSNMTSPPGVGPTPCRPPRCAASHSKPPAGWSAFWGYARSNPGVYSHRNNVWRSTPLLTSLP